MKCLGFERGGTVIAGRCVRRARFEERSLLPVSAACVVANGVRERLASLLMVPVELQVFEPVIPSASAWSEILESAMLFHVNGTLTEAAIVLRLTDACTLACAAFGEQISVERALSPIEREVITRLLRTLAGTLTSVCGAPSSASQHLSPLVNQVNPYATYFELSLERPVNARIGIALAQDPSPEPCGALGIETLRDVRIEARARFVSTEMPAQKILDLELGQILPLQSNARTALIIGGRRFASGSCGTRDGLYAVTIDEPVAA